MRIVFTESHLLLFSALRLFFYLLKTHTDSSLLTAAARTGLFLLTLHNSSHRCLHCSPTVPSKTLCLSAFTSHLFFFPRCWMLNAADTHIHTHAHKHTGLIRTMPQIVPEYHHKGMSPKCVCVCLGCFYVLSVTVWNVSQGAAVTCSLSCCQRLITFCSSTLPPHYEVDYV